MDTSKEYIEMCKKAQEIQELRKCNNDWKLGDFHNKGILSFDEEIHDSSIIWLPRQDQLQNMLYTTNGGNHTLLSMLNAFNDFVNECIALGFNFRGFEQLWLEFVMCEKFNKNWDFIGKQWITS